MDKQPRYITTTLPYVNASPHIGFALEIIQADALARFWRLVGEDVFFTTGTDEHGQKIAQKAHEEGRDVQEYVDHYAAEFQTLKDDLHLSYDNFIRTTDHAHIAAAQELWRRCKEAGDIYKKSYSGLYCVGDEMFLRDADLVDGKCPNHPNMQPIEIQEENYFFALSTYSDKLIEYIQKDSTVVPDWRREEAIAFIQNGLEDLSISRDISRMSWGVPVPDDETQVMYVWFDALTNYISTLGWPDDENGTYKKFWDEGATLQMAGKDQIRFQSIIWQAMLMSAGLPTTDTVFYHGFITSGGQKMSKSLGNVISPFELVERYGTEATRFLLLRHVHPTDDTDITWERLDEWYTADLVNGIGNLTARVMKLAEEHLSVAVPIIPEECALQETFGADVAAFKFNDALDFIFRLVAESDEFITEKQPFKKIKMEEEFWKQEAREEMWELVHRLWVIATHLEPFMPDTSKSIRDAILQNKKPENLFPRL